MNSDHGRFFQPTLAMGVVGLAMLAGLNVLMSGSPASGPLMGVVDDWTHHHVIFSNPGTAASALAQGRFEQWSRTVSDPRYQMQQIRRNPALASAPDFAARMALLQPPIAVGPRVPLRGATVKRDWSMDLGPFSMASISSTFSAEPTRNDTLTITNGTNSIVLTAATTGTGVCTSSSSTSYSGSFTRAVAATAAANLVALINTSNCGPFVGVSATNPGAPSAVVTITSTAAGSSGNSITVTASATGFDLFSTTATNLSGGVGAPPLGAGQYPAKYSFSTGSTGSCTDYVVYPTGAAGSSSQASVVAYTNIYATTCGSTVPTISWAYNTGGSADLSPVLSGDGKQVAFIQTAISVASLVLLKPSTSSGGTVSAPATITSATNANYRTCTAPCYTTLTLNGGRNDTLSPPFYDYINDIVWVGDSGGYLHKFTGVFNGTPAEASAGGWPVQASTETTPALNGPVFDSGASQLIFVGDATGYLHSVTTTGATSQTVLTANQNVCGTAGMVDPPIVDSVNEQVYVFVGDGCDVTPGNSYVNRFAAGTSISASYGQNYVNLSNAATNTTSSVMRQGNFDNTYYSGTGTTGNLYVCENGALYQIPMSGLGSTTAQTITTAFNTPVSTVASASTCSPVTEFYNPSGTAADYIFMSVAANGNASACTGACIYSYNVVSAGTTGTPVAGLASTGGSSGIIIDNSGAAPGESQIYFAPLGSQSCAGNGTTGNGTGGCAVQASQSALH